MTKAKTTAPEAKAQTEDPGLPLTAPGAPDQPGADIAAAFASPPEGEPVTATEIEANKAAFIANIEAQVHAEATEAAEAEAAAAAAAEATAKAEAEAAEAEAAAKAAEAAKAKLDRAQDDLDASANEAADRAALARELTTIATTIHTLNVTGHRLGLVSDLQDQWGAVIQDREGEGVTVEMRGITIDPADSMENALANWAMAARRAAADLLG